VTGSSYGGTARQRTQPVRLPAGAALTRRRAGSQRAYVPVLAGLITVAVFSGTVAVALKQFRGGFNTNVPVTVLSDRAGLVMYPGAKVKLHGAQVGTVASIEDMPDGQAAIHLAIEPQRLHLIPANVSVDIAATTAFGAKFVQLVPPDRPSPASMRAGQVLDADHVTVEVNTVFQQLTSVLSRIDPAKLNETLGAMALALNGRGEQTKHALSDLNAFLAKINPSLQNLSHDFDIAPTVLNAYADAGPDIVRILGNTTQLSQTFVEQQKNFDMLLISTIGLADIGTDVVGSNRQALTDVLHLLVPTTNLTNKYHEALNCGLTGMVPLAEQPPDPNPGFTVLAGLSWGVERYRYPGDLPKVAAVGGPQCKDELPLQFNTFPPYVVADVGTNPFKYGNQQNLLNSDLLKQILYGPLDGPPRNSAQIGQPG
jgi:phospholipid/cholesterol/gamma-HCH transport system substrate-binding protein